MPQVKTATIDDVLNEKHWDGPNGRIYYSTLVLDNGERGEIGAKKQDAFRIGDSLTYTSTSDERGTKFKKYFEPNVGGGGNGGNYTPRQQAPAYQGNGGGNSRNASFALSYAKDVMIAAMPFHQEITTNQWVEACVSAANKFKAWMDEQEKA